MVCHMHDATSSDVQQALSSSRPGHSPAIASQCSAAYASTIVFTSKGQCLAARPYLLELGEDEPRCDMPVSFRAHQRQLYWVVRSCKEPWLEQLRHMDVCAQHDRYQLMPALQL